MFDPNRRSALNGHTGASRQVGATITGGAGIQLAEHRPSALMQLNGAPDEVTLSSRLVKLKPKPAVLRVSSNDAFTLLWNGPGQWLVMSEQHRPDELRAIVEEALAGTDATLTDLSQARTILSLEGPMVKDLVAKGCPLDVDAMAAGDTAPTLFGHFNVQLRCLTPQHFHLYVFRSFGQAMWEALLEESLEFGCEILD